MAYNNTTSRDALSPLEKALFYYDLQLPYNIFIYTVLAPLTLLSNGMTMLGLYNSEQLRKSNSYKLMFNMSAVVVLQAAYVIVNNGIMRIVFTVRRMADNETLLSCGFRQMPFEVTVTVDQINIFLIAFDRFLAVAYPFYYKITNESKSYPIICILLPWLVGLSETVAKFACYPANQINQILLFCVMSTTRTKGFADYIGVRSMVLAVVTVLVYCTVIGVTKYRVYKSGNNGTALKKELGYRLMKTCTIDALVYTGSYFTSKLYYLIVIAYVTGDSYVALVPLSVTFQFLATIPRVFIYLYFNRDMRKYVKIVDIFRRNTKVSTLVTPDKSGSIRTSTNAGSRGNSRAVTFEMHRMK